MNGRVIENTISNSSQSPQVGHQASGFDTKLLVEVFTHGRFDCQNKAKSFALSGCCNKTGLPPHPSSSSRQSLRQMFLSLLAGIDISLRFQAAHCVARNSSQLRTSLSGIFYNLDDAHGGGQEGERQRNKLSKKASCSSFQIRGEIPHLLEHLQAEVMLQKLTETLILGNSR